MAAMCDLMDAAEELTNSDDYFFYAANIQRLPYERERFSQEKVYQEMEEDADSEKVYLLIYDRDFTDEAGITYKRTCACAGKAVGMALMNDEYELAARLLEAGVGLQLEAPFAISLYEGNRRLININTTQMELMANNREIPDSLFEALWKRAKETSIWPLKKAMQLQFEFTKDADNERLLYNVKRLRQQWEEAADVLLRAWINQYFNKLQSLSRETWEELFRELPDKGRHMFEAALLKSNWFARPYPSEWELATVTILWRLFQKYGGEEEIKESLIFMANEVVREKIGWNDGFERFFIEIFSDIGDFGDMYPQQRDACIQLLLKEEQVSLSVWQSILATDFVLVDCMDFYLEQLGNSKNGMLLPLFISAKFKEMEEREENGIVS